MPFTPFRPPKLAPSFSHPVHLTPEMQLTLVWQIQKGRREPPDEDFEEIISSNWPWEPLPPAPEPMLDDPSIVPSWDWEPVFTPDESPLHAAVLFINVCGEHYIYEVQEHQFTIVGLVGNILWALSHLWPVCIFGYIILNAMGMFLAITVAIHDYF